MAGALTLERRAARLFSARMFRPILLGRPRSALDNAIWPLREDLRLPSDATARDVIESAYRLLSASYRSEYFYKNLIASKLVIGKHRGSNVTMLSEFRIGRSVADCVFINGAGAVYEIKTEFDSPEKLLRQLENYYRVFPLVNVVAHENTAQRYLKVLESTNAGLLLVGSRSRLSINREATPNFENLDVGTMFNALRQNDIESILSRTFGPLEHVPNGRRYTERLSLARQMSPLLFQQEMQVALKQRDHRLAKELLLDPRMLPLRAILLQTNPTPAQGVVLNKWLESTEDDDVLPLSPRKAI